VLVRRPDAVEPPVRGGRAARDPGAGADVNDKLELLLAERERVLQRLTCQRLLRSAPELA
jgi:hypothetical protein